MLEPVKTHLIPILFSSNDISAQALLIMKSSLLFPLLVCNPSFQEFDKGGKCKSPYLKQCNNWLFEHHFIFDFPKGRAAGARQTSGPQGQPLASFLGTCLTEAPKTHKSTQRAHAKCSCRRGLCATRKAD